MYVNTSKSIELNINININQNTNIEINLNININQDVFTSHSKEPRALAAQMLVLKRKEQRILECEFRCVAMCCSVLLCVTVC